MRGRLAGWSEARRTQIWPLPAAGIVLATMLGVGLPKLDEHVDGSLSAGATAYLFGGGPSAARTLLGTIASSMVTVTALTFSLTVVTLQLASSQYSPRLLRTFTRDRFVHITLALLLGTFTFALAVLRTVRDQTDDQDAFVPQLSVTLAFVLTVSAVIALVLFLAHLAEQIRVETMLHNVHQDTREATRRFLADRPAGISSAVELSPPADAITLIGGASGFLLQIDEVSLLQGAIDAGAVLVLDRWPGDSLVAGTPIGSAWPHRGPIDADTAAALQRAIDAAVTVGHERTSTHDVGYGLRQLADIAIKALSPGINDPTTAVHALGHLSALLCELACYDLGPVLLHDERGELRGLLHRPGLAELLEVAVAQPRRYGAADPLVLARLFALLAEVAWTIDQPADRAAVAQQLSRLRDTADAEDLDAVEREHLQRLGLAVDAALTRT